MLLRIGAVGLRSTQFNTLESHIHSEIIHTIFTNSSVQFGQAARSPYPEGAVHRFSWRRGRSASPTRQEPRRLPASRRAANDP